MRTSITYIFVFVMLISTACIAETREWKILTTLEDGSTYSIDEKNIEYLSDGFFRVWRRQISSRFADAKVSEMIALHEIDCNNEKSRMIHVDFTYSDGRKESLDTPFTEPPYEWEDLDLMDLLLLLPYCKK